MNKEFKCDKSTMNSCKATIMDLNTKMDRVHGVYNCYEEFACMSDCVYSWDEAHRIFSPKGCSNERIHKERPASFLRERSEPWDVHFKQI